MVVVSLTLATCSILFQLFYSLFCFILFTKLVLLALWLSYELLCFLFCCLALSLYLYHFNYTKLCKNIYFFSTLLLTFSCVCCFILYIYYIRFSPVFLLFVFCYIFFLLLFFIYFVYCSYVHLSNSIVLCCFFQWIFIF